jgi:hypothetical protein
VRHWQIQTRSGAKNLVSDVSVFYVCPTIGKKIDGEFIILTPNNWPENRGRFFAVHSA